MSLYEQFDDHINNLALLICADLDPRLMDESILNLLNRQTELTLKYCADSSAQTKRDRIRRLAAVLMAESERMRDEACGRTKRRSLKFPMKATPSRRVQTNQLSIWK